MQPLAKELPPLPKLSDLAQPDYQWELLSNIAGEMWPLIVEKSIETFPEHEIRPPDPDWETYINMQVDGRLHIITARVNSKLVGYIVWVVSRSLHRKSELTAFTDTYYVQESWRHGHCIGKDMFNKSDSVLREMGCKTILAHSNDEFSESTSRWFTMMGFKHYGNVFIKE